MDRGAWGCRESDMIDQLSTAHGLGFQRMNRNPRLYCLHLVALDKLLSLSGPVHFIFETGDKKQSVVKVKHLGKHQAPNGWIPRSGMIALYHGSR